MKKYLMMTTAVAMAVAGTTGANAAWLGKGFYTSFTGGYASTTGKLKPEDAFTVKGTTFGSLGETTKRGGGAYFMGTLGHKATFGKGHFSGEFSVSYDTSKANVGELTAVAVGAPWNLVAATKYKLTYQPRFGLGLAARGGMHFTPDVLGYVRLGVEYNFAKVSIKTPGKSHEDSVKIWSFTPGIGLEGKINEKTAWLVGVDYKIAFSISKYNQASGFLNKPKTFIVRAGISYHF